MKKHEEILNYWFGNTSLLEKPSEEKSTIWFKKSDETDKEIKEKFEHYFESIESLDVNTLSTPEEVLGYIILVDQFSRNIFRNTPKSFSFDNKALELAFYGYSKGFDLGIDQTKSVFFYLPLEHSENIDNQLLCLDKFDTLVNESSEDMKNKMIFFKDYAIKHYDVIKKFGRFPHRNNILGRESTNEEIEFLKQPNSSF